MDRDQDGTSDCGADRPGYVFADYPSTPLPGGSTDCDTSGHMDYGEAGTSVLGCYDANVGWGQPMQVWWMPEEAKSCAELKRIHPELTDGEHTITIGGEMMVVYCDMTNGGRTRIINVPGTTPQDAYADVTAAAGSGASANSFYKLSDAAINALAEGHFEFSLTCGTLSRTVRRQQGWTSSRDAGGWEMDRDQDGTSDCGADRPGYVFADYPSTPLPGGSTDCDTSGHMDYGEAGTSVLGCYDANVGWGQPMQVWWMPAESMSALRNKVQHDAGQQSFGSSSGAKPLFIVVPCVLVLAVVAVAYKRHTKPKPTTETDEMVVHLF
eukprot:TRINITY_DN10377_c0_g1_i6.p1 TRINITY_DN10377_c0_g1~~TRINITY_DN10377_c0_g1_i6.p1  ORF type:complete len:324 (-),score=58.79 TRINITY_DN10377_c0_g1_i6:125-1096(-)